MSEIRIKEYIHKASLLTGVTYLVMRISDGLKLDSPIFLRLTGQALWFAGYREYFAASSPYRFQYSRLLKAP